LLRGLQHTNIIKQGLLTQKQFIPHINPLFTLTEGTVQ